MPTTTARLALPVPLSTDPANVPSDMLNLANALDEGANANYSGAAVMVATPGALGGLPANPIIGTFYCVSGSPPYLLYYSGESTPGTGTAPTGWRLVGQAGTNVSVISNTSPGNSASAGIQPVWAPLDHQHASLPWSLNQTTQMFASKAASDGNVNAYARANHSHGPTLVSGLIASDGFVAGPVTVTNTSFTTIGGGSVTINCNSLAYVTITANITLNVANTSCWLGFSISGATTVNPILAESLFFGGVAGAGLGITASAMFPAGINPGNNTFTLQAVVAGGANATIENAFITVMPVA